MASISFICYLVVLFVFSTFGMPNNPRKTFQKCPGNNFFDKLKNECQKCSTCPLGSGVQAECKTDDMYTDTLCVKCQPDVTFSSKKLSRGSPCHLCARCGGRKVLKRCTITSDTICGPCPDGKYWDSIWTQCRPCSYCYEEEGRAPKVKECIKSTIPHSYQCALLRSPPYPVPPLHSIKTPNGTTVFYTEKSLDSSSTAENTNPDRLEEFLDLLSIEERNQAPPIVEEQVYNSYVLVTSRENEFEDTSTNVISVDYDKQDASDVDNSTLLLNAELIIVIAFSSIGVLVVLSMSVLYRKNKRSEYSVLKLKTKSFSNRTEQII